jgi:NDP-sugar pyrophosphorylase family protein
MRPSGPLQIVLLCGGRGTRLGPANPDSRPKPLLPVHGIPLVEYLWRGYRHLTASPPIVVHAAADRLIPAWASSLEEGWVSCPQAKPAGSADAAASVASLLHGPALILLGDIALRGEFPEVFPEPPAVGIWKRAPGDCIRANFGVRVSGERITDLVEKPVDPSGWIGGIGAYLLAAEHLCEFAETPRDAISGEMGITEALRLLMARGYALRALPFTGEYRNVNEPEDLEAARHLLRE